THALRQRDHCAPWPRLTLPSRPVRTTVPLPPRTRHAAAPSIRPSRSPAWIRRAATHARRLQRHCAPGPRLTLPRPVRTTVPLPPSHAPCRELFRRPSLCYTVAAVRAPRGGKEMMHELSGYWYSRWFFERGLAAIYLVAFVVTLNQFIPLAGARGL